MKGFIVRTVRILCVAGGGVAAGAGCYGYQNLVDPCYPQRYEYAARQETAGIFAAQANNGHVLDQTIWNYEFEPASAALTPGGMEHLSCLARRRPNPDLTIYLQVAKDINYDPAKFADFVETREKLDAKRIRAIQDYLTATTSGRGLVFNVVRHDPSEVGMAGLPAATAMRTLALSAQGTLQKPTAGGGGAAPAAPAH